MEDGANGLNKNINISLIFNLPNAVKSEVHLHPEKALDIYQNLPELCNLKQTSHIEEKSLVSILNNPNKETKTKTYAYSVWLHKRWWNNKKI